MSSDLLYLSHIRQAIEKIQSYCAAGRDEFFRNPMVQDAVVRNFEIIGEATKRLSSAATATRSDIPWRRIAGFRNLLIHDYMGVDPQEVWNVVESHLDVLRDAIIELMERIE